MKGRAWIVLIVAVGVTVSMWQRAEGSPLTVSSEGQVIAPGDVSGILEAHLRRMISDRRKSVEVKEIRWYEKIALPPGTLSCEVFLPDQALRGGNVSGTIRFIVDGKEIRKIRVTAQVHIFADVVVARSYLKKHHVIGGNDLQSVNKDLSILAPDAVTDPEDLVGKRTTLTMNSQEVFRRGMVERVPLVKKGDRITLVVENRHFRITSMGEVQEEGGRGDRIRFLNVSSKREVYGRVLDANTAQIDY